MKYTKHSLKKIENLFDAIDYTVRYERGNFQSGYCMVENKRIAVINKFYDTEGRINVLLDILQLVEVEVENLDDKQQKFYKQLLKSIYSRTEEKTEESSN